ncbi:hypothetical protein ACSSV4_003203 [Roseovarius sp. MBR-154]|jgi:hypothetical protein
MALKRKTTRKLAPFAKRELDHKSPELGQRYGDYFFAAKAAGLADIEQVVDFYDIPFRPPVAEAHARDNLSDTAAEALLQKVGPNGWGYHMPLSARYGTMGALDGLSGAYALARKRADYRLNLIFTGLEQVLEGGVQGRSVLDIACNWGGFSVEAKLRGAAQVQGFDIRNGNIVKARMLRAHYGVEMDLSVADIYDFTPSEPFDVVLNLGLMYHITQPVEMMKKTFALTRHVAVLDTVTHREPFSGFILGTGAAASEHAATAVGMELHPTYRALVDLAYLVGFRDVVEVHGIPQAGWTGFEQEPYGNKTRRCILCIK